MNVVVSTMFVTPMVINDTAVYFSVCIVPNIGGYKANKECHVSISPTMNVLI